MPNQNLVLLTKETLEHNSSVTYLLTSLRKFLRAEMMMYFNSILISC